MLLNSVIILLREVLEAAVLTSILLGLCKHLRLSMSWFIMALVSGFFGAVVYALNIATISEMFDYTGQERVNGFTHVVIFMCLLLVVYLINFKTSISQQVLTTLMTLCIALAITREGSEIYLYLSSFVSDQEQFSAVAAGGVIGTSIGLSVGTLTYYAMVYTSTQKVFYSSQLLIAVIASGILSQTVPLFMQADLLPAQSALWDSSFLLSEDSALGQLTYAITGYEATPTLLQVCVNMFSLCTFFSLLSLAYYRNIKKTPD